MIQVFIEAEAGSHTKNLYDEKTLKYKGTRHVRQPYPYPYGFILGTCGADGDGVDCYVITKETIKVGTVVECEPFGLLEQNEGDEIDHKVLATFPGQTVKSNEELLKELQDFIYAIFAEFPEVQVRVERILSCEAALNHIQNFKTYESSALRK